MTLEKLVLGMITVTLFEPSKTEILKCRENCKTLYVVPMATTKRNKQLTNGGNSLPVLTKVNRIYQINLSL